MAKAQKRSNREQKKLKQDKPKPAVARSALAEPSDYPQFGGYPGIGDVGRCVTA